MKKLTIMFAFMAMVMGFGGCKKNDVNNNTSVNTFDASSLSARQQKINRAKAFYEKMVATKSAAKTFNSGGTPNWNEVSTALIPNKGESIVVPVNFTGETVYKSTTTNETFSENTITQLWMHEKAPNDFTVEVVKSLVSTNPNTKEVYFVEDLVNNTEKIMVEENGQVFLGMKTIATAQSTLTYSVHCDIFERYIIWRDNDGNVIYEQYMDTYQICEITGQFYSDDGGGGFYPTDDDANMEVTKPYQWLVKIGGTKISNTMATGWEVKSYELITAKKKKNVAGIVHWELVNAVHSKSDVFNYNQNQGLQVSYKEEAAACSLTSVDDAYADVMGKVVDFNNDIPASNNKTIHRFELFP